MNNAEDAELKHVTRAREAEPQATALPESHSCRSWHQLPVTPELAERPVSPEFPESPCVSVCPLSPVSEGQGLDAQREKALKALAARNACTERNNARKRRWQLERDLKALEK